LRHAESCGAAGQRGVQATGCGRRGVGPVRQRVGGEPALLDQGDDDGAELGARRMVKGHVLAKVVRVERFDSAQGVVRAMFLQKLYKP
jgi:hypothetical protein